MVNELLERRGLGRVLEQAHQLAAAPQAIGRGLHGHPHRAAYAVVPFVKHVSLFRLCVFLICWRKFYAESCAAPTK